MNFPQLLLTFVTLNFYHFNYVQKALFVGSRIGFNCDCFS